MSKGSRPRASAVSPAELAQRHESIFGAKPPRQPYVAPPLPDELNVMSSFEKLLGTTKLPPGRT
jgi:hypothetical protein